MDVPTRSDACAVPLFTQESNNTLVTVDPKPTGVTAAWVPGLNKPCHPAKTEGNAELAASLAAAVAAAKAAPASTSCPTDSGAGVLLYFSYQGEAKSEYVAVRFDGCRFIGAPGRDGRRPSADLDRSLLQIAPPAWRQYLG
jgi:hypothetical protein